MPGRWISVVVGAAVLAGVAWLALRGIGDEPVAPPDPSTPRGARAASGQPDPIDRAADRAVAETGREQPRRVTTPEAPRVVRFVEQGSGVPLPGVRVVALPDMQEIAVSDAAGRCRLTDAGAGMLVAAAAGHLLRRFVPRPAVSEDRPPEVELWRDIVSPRLQLELTGATGGAARFDLEVLQAREPAAATGGGADLARAWSEHRMLAELPGLAADVLRGDARHVALGAGGGVFRLLGAGRFRLTVAAVDGQVGDAEFTVDDAASRGVVLRVPMRTGGFLEGAVVDATTGMALPGARVTVGGGDPLQLTAESDALGRFRIGPLVGERVDLVAVLEGREPLRAGPFPVSGTAPARLVLSPPAARRLHGLVRSRPGGRPVADAGVEVFDGSGPVAQVRTAADGGFAVPVAPGQPLRLTIAASGFVRYVEALEPEQAASPGPLVCELLPANEALRLASGLTGVVRGEVYDGTGAPAVGVPVRLQPEQVVTEDDVGQQPRQIREGGRVELPLLVRTDAAGRFVIESPFGGASRLLVLGAATPLSVRIELRLGETTSVERLRLP